MYGKKRGRAEEHRSSMKQHCSSASLGLLLNRAGEERAGEERAGEGKLITVCVKTGGQD